MSGLALSLFSLKDWEGTLLVCDELLAIHPGMDHIGQLRQVALKKMGKSASRTSNPGDMS